MGEMHVYELARELCITNKYLIDYLTSKGISVASHMTRLDNETVSFVRASFTNSIVKYRDTIKKTNPTVLIRRKIKAPDAQQHYEVSQKKVTDSKYFNENPMRHTLSPLPDLNTASDKTSFNNQDLGVLAETTELRKTESIFDKKSEQSSLLKLAKSNPKMYDVAAESNIDSEKLKSTAHDLGYDEIKSDDQIEKTLHLTLFNDFSNPVSGKNDETRKTRANSNTTYQMNQGLLKNKTFVIDALNVCLSFPQRINYASISYLLSLIIEIHKQSGYFIAVFDRSAKYRFKEISNDEFECYEYLTSNTADYCLIVPARIRADDFILQMAEKNNCDVISNDMFREYETRYPWVKDDGRVKKGAIIPQHSNGKKIQDILSIPNLEIYANVRKDFQNMAQEIVSIFN
jgi:hypothetical protein